MADHRPSRRAIPLDSDGVARLIREFDSHLEVLPRAQADHASRKPLAWEEDDLREIRRAVHDPGTGLVDIEAQIRSLALYTEVPTDVIRNVALLSLGRIAQKIRRAQGSLAFRHGTFLRIETDPAKIAEVFNGPPPQDRILVNVWPPGSDLSSPPVRRVPVPILEEGHKLEENEEPKGGEGG